MTAMKIYNKILPVLLTVLTTVLSGCNRDMEPDTGGITNGSDSVKVKIGFEVSDETGVKSEQDNSVPEIEDINIYILDKNGIPRIFDYRKYEGDMEFELLCGIEYNVFVIANAGKAMPIKNYTDLMNLDFGIESTRELTGRAQNIMSGCSGKPEPTYDGMRMTVKLSRCLSSIRVFIDDSGLDSDTRIYMFEAGIRNIPKKVSYFGESAPQDTDAFFQEGYDATIDEVDNMLENGCTFYTFENMQGNLLPDIDNQKEKKFEESDPRSKICTYIELTTVYDSPEQKGFVKYRFYLGADTLGNFDITRNCRYDIVVSFKGSGINENSWRIDCSSLEYRPREVIITPSEYTLRKKGETLKLMKTVLPANTTNKNVYWESSDPKVCTIDQTGMVTAVNDGKATITATAKGDYRVKGQCNITVDTRVFAEEIRLDKTETDVTLMESVQLHAEVKPSNTTDKSLSWTSLNPEICIVDSNGKLTGKRIGKTKIRVTANDGGGASTECSVNVVYAKPERIEIYMIGENDLLTKGDDSRLVDRQYYTMKSKGKAEISWKEFSIRVYPENADQNITANWYVSDENGISAINYVKLREMFDSKNYRLEPLAVIFGNHSDKTRRGPVTIKAEVISDGKTLNAEHVITIYEYMTIVARTDEKYRAYIDPKYLHFSQGNNFNSYFNLNLLLDGQTYTWVEKLEDPGMGERVYPTILANSLEGYDISKAMKKELFDPITILEPRNSTEYRHFIFRLSYDKNKSFDDNLYVYMKYDPVAPY